MPPLTTHVETPNTETDENSGSARIIGDCIGRRWLVASHGSRRDEGKRDLMDTHD